MDPTTARELTRKPPRRVFASITSQLGAYQADIAFMRYSESAKYRAKNDGMSCLLIVIETASRYAYAKPLPNKGAQTVLEAFRDIYDGVRQEGRYINQLTTDDGPEFNNRAWDALMNECQITQYVKEPGDRYSLGIIDRFTRTLKTVLEDLQIVNRSLNWIGFIDRVLDHYNHRINRNTGASPVEIRADPSALETSQVLDESRGEAGVELFNRFKVGDHVRIRLRPYEQPHNRSSLAHPSEAVSKGVERWSFRVFVIQKIDGLSFELVDSAGRKLKRTYRAHELLPVAATSHDAPDLFAGVASQARKARRARREDL